MTPRRAGASGQTIASPSMKPIFVMEPSEMTPPRRTTLHRNRWRGRAPGNSPARIRPALDMRGRSLILDGLQALRVGRRGGRRSHTDHDGNVGIGAWAEHVDPDRCVGGVVRERVPDVAAHSVAFQADAEQLSCGAVETGQMEVHAERPTAPDLHRGEVARAAQIKGPYLLDGGSMAVDLDPREPNVTHE